jgi:hypothetical protein
MIKGYWMSVLPPGPSWGFSLGSPWQVADNIENFQKRLEMLLSLTDAGSPKTSTVCQAFYYYHYD